MIQGRGEDLDDIVIWYQSNQIYPKIDRINLLMFKPLEFLVSKIQIQE